MIIRFGFGRFVVATQPAIVYFRVPASTTPTPTAGRVDENPFFCHVGRMMGHG
jgi:hypothetical protein